MPDEKSTGFSEIDGEKAALRKILRARRAAHVEEMETALGGHAAAVEVEVLADKVPKKLFPRMRGMFISGFMPLKDEIDPFFILSEAKTRGMLVAMPRTPPKGSGQPLTFHYTRLGNTGWDVEWETSSFGVREPPPSKPVTPRLMIVPLLGFDRRGYRLGYGAGHYDRTIAAIRALPDPCVAIGVAFACQEVDRIPTDDFDQQLDWIVTPQEAIGPLR